MFEENSGQANWKARGTVTVNDKVGICYMRFVIWTVDIFIIPARWESQFNTKSIMAISINEALARQEMTIQGSFITNLIVETIKPYCFLLQSILSDICRSPK